MSNPAAPKPRHSQPVLAGAAEPASRASQPAIATRRAAGGDKREAILDAALELFVERGFFGTAVPEIADRAGVGAGTIYRYFESKEALVNAIYRQQKLVFANVVLDGFPATAATREQFRMLWMRMAQFAIEHTNAFIFLELHHHARYLDAESRAVEARMLELFTSVVTAAQARGELKAGPPRLLMGLVMGAFVGVIRSCVEVELQLDRADWKLAEQCIWEAVRA
ncbi:MAG TPA: TetR/AcrR family transcriptional regulator [Kofleriaceae bacterium]|nr:TetR/AcrR family transcriptional regulator [Kofleriaceae bacterium]